MCLTAAGEDLVGRSALGWCLVLIRWRSELFCYSYRIFLRTRQCIVTTAKNTCTAEGVEDGAVAAALGRFRGVSSDVL